MNRTYYIIILAFYFIPGVLFAQNLRINEVRPFVEIENRNFQKAIDSLELMIENNTQPAFYFALAKAYYKLGNLDKAIEKCYELDRIKPGYSNELKVRIFIQAEDFKSAEKALEENLKSKYKIPLYQLMNDNEFMALNSQGFIDKMISSNYYSKTEKQLYQLERLIKNKKYEQALFLANGILGKNRSIDRAHYYLAVISNALNDHNRALESINAAVNLKRANLEYLHFRALVCEELKEYDIALQDIKKIIRIDPYNIDNYTKEADLLFQTKKFNEAIELTNQILKLNSNNSDIMYLGSKSYYQKDEYIDALKLINESLELKANKESYELRGDIYTATNTFEYAIRDYSMYLDIEPYNGDIYTKKGLARYKSGDKKGACSDWVKAKRYGSYDAIQYLEKYCE